MEPYFNLAGKGFIGFLTYSFWNHNFPCYLNVWLPFLGSSKRLCWILLFLPCFFYKFYISSFFSRHVRRQFPPPPIFLVHMTQLLYHVYCSFVESSFLLSAHIFRWVWFYGRFLMRLKASLRALVSDKALRIFNLSHKFLWNFAK